MIGKKWTLFPVLLVMAGIASSAAAATLKTGEWETTSQISTPQGMQTFTARTCNKQPDVAGILSRHDQHCGNWQESGPDGSGTYTLHGVCSQNGTAAGKGLNMQVEAQITVEADGRSVRGTTQSSGEVNGFSFSSPPVPFTSRYIGACTQH